MNPDFRDILCIFIDRSVEFLVVGAYAVAVHGVPRATGDIDLWVRPESENARRAWEALALFGAPMAELTEKDLSTPGLIFQIGVAPRRIDILTSIDGVTFDAAWQARVTASLDGIAVPVLSRADLVRNKVASARPKDLADIALLDEAAGR